MNNAEKKKVLILCTGNSCRSQMAEAIINEDYSDGWEAYSAGTDPSGYVHPKAIEVLAEIGIQYQGRSKHTDEFRCVDFDLVITVCDDAHETCPLWLGKGERVHSGFQDPAEATGTQEEVIAVFRQVRDQIRETIPGILKEHNLKED